jgi:farnesyl diphosphate synthase
VEDLLIQCKNKYNLPPPMLKRIKELCYYTIPGGKLYRGSLVINTVKAFYDAKGADASPMIPSAMVVAWCIEILQACFLIADDIMDKAPARRGKPCWHIKTGESMAFNDSVFLESTVYFFLKQHFSSSPAVYMGLTDLFREISFMTEMGQMMDLAAERCQGDATSLQGFNIEMYSQIAIKKTALYTFYLPIAAGMMLCGVSDQEVLTQCRAICEELGTKYQIQDDYLDCFGDVDVTGKIGTDIQDHKCTWLMITALLLASLEQKSILQSNYGKSDEKSVERIKNMYIELGLKEAYLKQEQESYEKIKVKVEECSLIPRGVFMPILEKIHGRVK